MHLNEEGMEWFGERGERGKGDARVEKESEKWGKSEKKPEKAGKREEKRENERKSEKNREKVRKSKIKQKKRQKAKAREKPREKIDRNNKTQKTEKKPKQEKKTSEKKKEKSFHENDKQVSALQKWCTYGPEMFNWGDAIWIICDLKWTVLLKLFFFWVSQTMVTVTLWRVIESLYRRAIANVQWNHILSLGIVTLAYHGSTILQRNRKAHYLIGAFFSIHIQANIPFWLHMHIYSNGYHMQSGLCIHSCLLAIYKVKYLLWMFITISCMQ